MEIPQHKMEISLVKDSLEEILEDSGPIEPSDETSIAVENYIYN